MVFSILAINPGSTSTKLALYQNETLIFSEQAEHSDDDFTGITDVLDQLDYRLEVILSILNKHQTPLGQLDAVVGRGGLLPPVKAGGYLVNEKLKEIINSGTLSPHASNLGALLADKIAAPLGIPAYIYDSVSSDEFKEIAMITGIPEYLRHSQCHVLNSKAMGRRAAAQLGKRYEDLNLIVAHLGGGISIGIHEKGRIVDAIGDDAGPFSPERTGGLPLLYIVDLCYSGEYTKKEMTRKIRGLGGIKAHLGTHDCRIVERMISQGNEKAKLVYEAEAYQIAKGIGELAPVLNGEIDYILLTGGIAYSKMMTEMIRKRVEFIAPVIVIPGEMEMEALALGALRMLQGEEIPSIF
ncbi:butyrate kinase [Anoxybacterium hadale]|uniref:Butyrate kinase n=1 Tax=Anoxybacterium hadale TaxID=3408580 RepID=A0ACD1A9J0_9FIRM|nr:butyrate kinase [Clostridiales bacterium]